MRVRHLPLPLRLKNEAEKPFWISFADLMTALMLLFLVAMSVTLLSVTRHVDEAETRLQQRQAASQRLLAELDAASRRYPGVQVDKEQGRIDFGEIVRFDSGAHSISPQAAQQMRQYVREVLRVSQSADSQRWLKHIAVEGFTDQDGSYLYNLELSLKRSHSVVCALFAAPEAGETPLSDAELQRVRDLFLVGGFSFNAAKASKEQSRRVELRLDFWQANETPKIAEAGSSQIGRCTNI